MTLEEGFGRLRPAPDVLPFLRAIHQETLADSPCN